MQEAHPDVDIYIGALDQKLNDHGYIVPDWEMQETVFRYQIKETPMKCQTQRLYQLG